jgi:transcriptional regulator with XRE-family HTH domain
LQRTRPTGPVIVSPPRGPRKRRPRRALTQAELAERAGVTTATVARIERDEIEPRMTTLRKLARALEVDPAELVE